MLVDILLAIVGGGFVGGIGGGALGYFASKIHYYKTKSWATIENTFNYTAAGDVWYTFFGAIAGVLVGSAFSLGSLKIEAS